MMHSFRQITTKLRLPLMSFIINKFIKFTYCVFVFFFAFGCIENEKKVESKKAVTVNNSISKWEMAEREKGEHIVGIWLTGDSTGLRIRESSTFGYVLEYIDLNDYNNVILNARLSLQKRSDGKIIFKNLDDNFGEYFLLEGKNLLDYNEPTGFLENYKVVEYYGLK